MLSMDNVEEVFNVQHWRRVWMWVYIREATMSASWYYEATVRYQIWERLYPCCEDESRWKSQSNRKWQLSKPSLQPLLSKFKALDDDAAAKKICVNQICSRLPKVPFNSHSQHSSTEQRNVSSSLWHHRLVPMLASFWILTRLCGN